MEYYTPKPINERKVFPVAIHKGKPISDFSKVGGNYPSTLEALYVCDKYHNDAIKGKYSYCVFKEDGTHFPDLNNEEVKYVINPKDIQVKD